MSNQNGFESDEQEAYEYERYMRSREQEPDVVPCYECGDQMYEVSAEPANNRCDNCLAKLAGNDLLTEDSDTKNRQAEAQSHE